MFIEGKRSFYWPNQTLATQRSNGSLTKRPDCSLTEGLEIYFSKWDTYRLLKGKQLTSRRRQTSFFGIVENILLLMRFWPFKRRYFYHFMKWLWRCSMRGPSGFYREPFGPHKDLCYFHKKIFGFRWIYNRMFNEKKKPFVPPLENLRRLLYKGILVSHVKIFQEKTY